MTMGSEREGESTGEIGPESNIHATAEMLASWERQPYTWSQSEPAGQIEAWRNTILQFSLTVSLAMGLVALGGLFIGKPETGRAISAQLFPGLVIVSVALLWRQAPRPARAWANMVGMWSVISVGGISQGFGLPGAWVGSLWLCIVAALVFNRRQAVLAYLLTCLMWALIASHWVGTPPVDVEALVAPSVLGNWLRELLLFASIAAGAMGAVMFMVNHLKRALWRTESLYESLVQAADALNQDITELNTVRVEQERISNDLTRLIDTANAPIFGIDPEGKINEWNQQAEKITGFSKQYVMGRELVGDFIADDYKASVAEILQRALQGEETANYEFPLFTKSGDRVDVLLNSTTRRDSSGQAIGVVGVGQDITELNKVRDEKSRAQQEADIAKSEFIATVSHELRTPLTSIKGALGLINTGALGELPDKIRPMLNIALSNSNRLVSLINDILDIEKLEAGKMRFQMHPTNLSALLEESVAANEGYGEEYGVSFSSTDLYGPLFVQADPDRLMQVMANLLSNAAKFSSRGGQVEVSLTRHDGSLRLAVKDYGCGIPEDARATIFEKFTQGDASDQRQKGGTGLGLSIVKMVVEEHDGRIDFITEVGEGTTFYVDLPEIEVEDGSSTIELPVKEQTPHLLIVEGDPDVAHLLEYTLRKSGYRTSIAGTLDQARSLLSTDVFDAMILDLSLPNSNGGPLLNDLHKQPETHDLPVIVVSPYIDKGKIEPNAAAVNAVEWVQKPVDPQLLLSAIRRTLGRCPDVVAQILHVDDDENICEIIATVVADTTNIIAARSLKDAIVLLARQRFDVVILELELPDGSAERLLPLLNLPPQTSPPVVIFSAKDAPVALVESVHRVLVKSQTSNQEILETIQSALGVKRTAILNNDGEVL